jgi:hypothetical protein
MAKKREVLDFQSIIKPPSVEEILYHISWLNKDDDCIQFIQVRLLFPDDVIFHIIIF